MNAKLTQPKTSLIVGKYFRKGAEFQNIRMLEYCSRQYLWVLKISFGFDCSTL